MAITALDIHEKEFGHGMRGYKENEVDDFLDLCAAEVDRLAKENEVLKTQLEQVKRAPAAAAAPVVPSVQPEPVVVPATRVNATEIGDVLVLAQRTAEDLIAKARAQADEIMSAAEGRASEIVEDAATRKREIIESAKNLKKAEIVFRDKYRTLLEQSIASIKEISIDADFDIEEVASVKRATRPSAAVASPEVTIEAAAVSAKVAEAPVPVAEEVAPAPGPIDPGILEASSFAEQIEFEDDFEIEEID